MGRFFKFKIIIMRKSNTLQHPNGFVFQLIDRLAGEDKETIEELDSFFSEHLLLVLPHEIFEDENYRSKYSDLLLLIKNIVFVYQQYSKEEIRKAFENVDSLFSMKAPKDRKEVLNA